MRFDVRILSWCHKEKECWMKRCWCVSHLHINPVWNSGVFVIIPDPTYSYSNAMKAVILRPFHRAWAKCDGTHSAEAIMFCGSTLTPPSSSSSSSGYKIGRTPSKYWSLTLILRLWQSTADMILSMCICSNTSKDVSACVASRWRMRQGWSNLEGAFEETHLAGTRLAARHHLVDAPVESRFIYLHFFVPQFFVCWQGGS